MMMTFEIQKTSVLQTNQQTPSTCSIGDALHHHEGRVASRLHRLLRHGNATQVLFEGTPEASVLGLYALVLPLEAYLVQETLRDG